MIKQFSGVTIWSEDLKTRVNESLCLACHRVTDWRFDRFRSMENQIRFWHDRSIGKTSMKEE